MNIILLISSYCNLINSDKYFSETIFVVGANKIQNSKLKYIHGLFKMKFYTLTHETVRVTISLTYFYNGYPKGRAIKIDKNDFFARC